MAVARCNARSLEYPPEHHPRRLMKYRELRRGRVATDRTCAGVSVPLHRLGRMREQGASLAKLEEARREQRSYAWMANPLATGGFYFLETAAIGMLLSLIAAGFLR